MSRVKIYFQKQLASLGNVVSLKDVFSPREIEKTIFAYRDYFKIYNLKKTGYNRYGLSITSQDGGFSGIPDLDSLLGYNQQHGTNFGEQDFRKWTPFFKDCTVLREGMSPFHNFIGRSHV